jgi:hypothetical protein
LRRKPANLSTEEWKEKRRNAARELGRRRERAAVPALIEVVEAEKFDIVAEHAIEALAAIGDERALEPLRAAADDGDRDPDGRQAARRALERLGAAADARRAAEAEGPSQGGEPGSRVGPGPGDRVLGGADLETPQAPEFPDDTLAASEQLTLVLGGLRFSYDSLRDIPALDGDAVGRYRRLVERTDIGFDYGIEAGVVAGALDFPGDDSASRTGAVSGRGDAEIRFYFAEPPLFVLAAGAANTSLTAVKIDRPAGDGEDTNEIRLGIDLTATAGLGIGRVLERGEELRVRRIAQALRQRRLLGRPITPELTESLLATWWSLRGAISPRQQLLATIEILRHAGVLLDEPDPATTYELLQILLDGNLVSRPDGMSGAIGISETLLVRDDALDLEDGRVENVIARGRYGAQGPDGLQEIVGQAAARYRILAGDDDAPWLVLASASYRRFLYTDAFDPIGGVEIGAEIGASDDGDDSSIATRIGGRVGWIFALNRASRLRIAADAALESGELFVGASIEASYGFLDVSFIGAPASLGM